MRLPIAYFKKNMSNKCLIFIGCLFFLAAPSVLAQDSIAQMMTEQQQILSGQELYQRHCMGCHGIAADGKGLAASMLNPKPRNLVNGSFKFRSTPSGTLPTTDDLIRTISQGVLGASMPNYKFLSYPQKLSLALYIKSLRKDWKANQGIPYFIPEAPKEIFGSKATLLASAQRGYKTYAENCLVCHGVNGEGNGESAEGLVDDDNQPIRPANYAARFIKSGKGASDIYKAITTGLDGSPMPAFADTLSDKERWDVVAYVMFRRGQGAGIYDANVSLDEMVKMSSAKPTSTVPQSNQQSK